MVLTLDAENKICFYLKQYFYIFITSCKAYQMLLCRININFHDVGFLHCEQLKLFENSPANKLLISLCSLTRNDSQQFNLCVAEYQNYLFTFQFYKLKYHQGIWRSGG
jgi:hypothetical protein